MSNIDFYRDGDNVHYNLPNPNQQNLKRIYIWGLIFGISNSFVIACILFFASFMQFKDSGGSNFVAGAGWFLMAAISCIYPIFTIWSLRKLMIKIKSL